MVLPSPAADPGAAQARAWLEKLIRPLELARDGILLCLRDATPTQIGPVVRALSPAPPWARSDDVLRVCLRATEVLDLPVGSRVLLRVHPRDLDWLNVARPLFAERKLRTILWADSEAMDGLIRRAVDFFDWVSRILTVPTKAVPDFAVAGMEAAIASNAEVAWTGAKLSETLAAAGVRHPIELHVEEPYVSLVSALGDDRLPIVSGLMEERDIWRIRMAMAEAGYEGCWIAREPGEPMGAMWPLHATQADWDQSSESLREAGWRRPALTSAWLDLHPERIARARAHVDAPPQRLAFARSVMDGSDPSKEADLVRALRSLDCPPPSQAVAAAVDAGFPEVAASLTLARWDNEASGVDANQLIEWLIEDGDTDTARRVLDVWRTRSGDTNVNMAHWQRELGPTASLAVADLSQSKIDDFELLQHWSAGDRGAGNKLAERHYPALMHYFRMRFGQDTADLVQETFQRFFGASSKLERTFSVRTYLLRIAHHVSLERLRQRSRRQHDQNLQEDLFSISDDGINQESLLVQTEKTRLLFDALRVLQPNQREVIELYYFQKMTRAEIAEILSIPVGTVGSKLAAARRQLAQTYLELEGRAPPKEGPPLETRLSILELLDQVSKDELVPKG